MKRILFILLWAVTVLIHAPSKAMKLSPSKKIARLLVKKNEHRTLCTQESPCGPKITKIINTWDRAVITGVAFSWVALNVTLSYKFGFYDSAKNDIKKKMKYATQMDEQWRLEREMYHYDKKSPGKKTILPALGFIFMPIMSEAALWHLGKAYPKGSYIALQAACYGLGYVVGKVKEK